MGYRDVVEEGSFEEDSEGNGGNAGYLDAGLGELAGDCAGEGVTDAVDVDAGEGARGNRRAGSLSPGSPSIRRREYNLSSSESASVLLGGERIAVVAATTLLKDGNEGYLELLLDSSFRSSLSLSTAGALLRGATLRYVVPGCESGASLGGSNGLLPCPLIISISLGGGARRYSPDPGCGYGEKPSVLPTLKSGEKPSCGGLSREELVFGVLGPWMCVCAWTWWDAYGE